MESWWKRNTIVVGELQSPSASQLTVVTADKVEWIKCTTTRHLSMCLCGALIVRFISKANLSKVWHDPSGNAVREIFYRSVFEPATRSWNMSFTSWKETRDQDGRRHKETCSSCHDKKWIVIKRPAELRDPREREQLLRGITIIKL